MKLPRMLVSYWYWKETPMREKMAQAFGDTVPEMFADSGAFQALSIGARITVDEYADWVEKYADLIQVYSVLDVIKDAETTRLNQLKMEERGLRPLPAFHVLEDFSWLEKYLEDHTYVALGVAGMQGRRKAVMRWLAQCFKMAQGRAVFHGFGLTGWEVMKSFPWYSVDSSSWTQCARWGQIQMWDARKGLQKAGHVDVPEIWTRICKMLNLPPEHHTRGDRSRTNRYKMLAAALMAYDRAEEYLRKMHGEVWVPGRPELGAGFKVYQAEVTGLTMGQAVNLAKAVEVLRAQGCLQD